jgi:PII-like signaling protein
MEKLKGEATLLRIFVGELDKVNGRPLYEVIVYAAKKYGLAGATVLRGIMSYGAGSIIHTARILSLSDDLPVVIEIVDESSKIQEFVKVIEPFFPGSKYGGMITTEKVNVIYYKPADK